MLNIIKNYLNDIKRTEDGFYIGYLDTAELYKQFLAELKEAGFYFSVRDSERFKEDGKKMLGFSKVLVNKPSTECLHVPQKGTGQFLFKCNKSNVPVSFSGSPFRREKNIMYQCAYGSQYYGKLKKSDSYESDQDACDKKRLRIRHSKKLGCKAKMAVKCIRIYLDYKISSDNAHWRLKKEVISTLKRDFMSEGCEVKSISRYFVKISEAEQHCHSPMHPKATIKKKMKLANRKNSNPVGGECEGESEIHLLERTDADIEGEVSLHTISNFTVKEESVSLREQCRKKNKEIMNLSYLCHDEDQLKELLVELTRVTEKLNENVSQSAETICVESEAPQAIGEEVCLSNEVSQTLVIDNDLCLEIEAPKTVVVDKEICLEIDKEICLDGETHRALVVKKESKRRLHKENEKPYVRTLQSKRAQKTIPANQLKVIEKQKKALGQNLLEAPNIEILQSNGISEDSVILFIY